ncbi:Uncharacterised protein [Vibrio cholerae]|nr:Uncharacterised protein [Vibrio cholerae]
MLPAGRYKGGASCTTTSGSATTSGSIIRIVIGGNGTSRARVP